MKNRKKVTSMSVREFMQGGEAVERPSMSKRVAQHFEKYGIVYKIAGATVVILIAGGGFDYAFAANGLIDKAGKKLYYEIVNVGKWIIIFKGGFDTVKAIVDQDIPSAKKAFFQHLMIYLMLLGLPFAMDKVDEVFNSLQQV